MFKKGLIFLEIYNKNLNKNFTCFKTKYTMFLELAKNISNMKLLKNVERKNI